jgi:hypothetical protein
LSDYAQTTWWWFTNHSSLSYAPSQLNEKVAQIQDPCHNEFVLRKLGTSAFAINALAMTYESATTTLAADLVTIPSGSCDLTLERWPLSGPHGISWPVAPPPAYEPPPNQSTLPRKASKAGAS